MDIDRCINQYNAAVRNGNKPRNLDWEKVARHIIKIGCNCVVYAEIKEDWDSTVGINMTMVKLFMKRRIPLVNGAHRL